MMILSLSCGIGKLDYALVSPVRAVEAIASHVWRNVRVASLNGVAFAVISVAHSIEFSQLDGGLGPPGA
jgi:hypothetical protein